MFGVYEFKKRPLRAKNIWPKSWVYETFGFIFLISFKTNPINDAYKNMIKVKVKKKEG